ncbi:unnamed protein product [Cylicostephanus goldi]|uniref:NR LBD domain-containing protein n=1 Tax=Cylicostephanus goldi TaxID=71465 RepID=A0A3P7N8Z9_CYLGO|nr:unnamed protein product [Cylicostephanus goldi]
MAPFADFIFDLAQRLAELGPDPAEMLLMEALIAFSDARRLQETQEVYMDALQQYTDVKQPKDSTRCHRLLALLADLRRYCVEHVDASTSNHDYDSVMDVKPEKAMLEQIMQHKGPNYTMYHIPR